MSDHKPEVGDIALAASGGQIAMGDVVRVGNGYADVMWRLAGHTERINLNYPNGVRFEPAGDGR